MKNELLAAAATLSALALAPNLAQARDPPSLAAHDISYLHNYGRGSRRHLRLL